MMRPITILLFFILCSISYDSTAQAFKHIVEKRWIGSSEQDADFTKNGKVYFSQTLSLTLNNDYTVAGIGTTTMTLDGYTYISVAEVKGMFNPAEWTLFIKEEEYTRTDPLPKNLKWCKGWGTVGFFENAEKNGHYLLKGDMTDECGSTSYMELHDEDVATEEY
jgi:hypothetical protein